MKSEQESFRTKVMAMSREELVAEIMDLYTGLTELRHKSEENERILTEAYIRYSSLEKKYNDLLDKYKVVSELLGKEKDKNAIQNKKIFGRGSETFDSLVSTAGTTEEDPTAEDLDAPDSADASCDEDKSSARKLLKKKTGSKTPKKHGGGRTRSAIEGLPVKTDYMLSAEDIAAADRKFGVGCWRILDWTKHETIERIPSLYYNHCVYTPVFAIGNDHTPYKNPYDGKLLSGSYLSASFIADLMYNKHGLGIPYARQAAELARLGIPVSKQTIIRRTNELSNSLFPPVQDYLIRQMKARGYNQCDETTAEVIDDGRKAGAKSYMWVHSTSELSEGPAIVVFCFELTRGTDHLRKIYRDFIGYITSDGYISYRVTESESNGDIKVSGCLMHCRRYFAMAFFVHDISMMTDEEADGLPEMKILLIIAEIYSIEKPLRHLPADERLAVRIEKEKPLMEKMFEYIGSLDRDENKYGDRLQKAINYAINQKDHLMRYFEDGNIPIDDGYSERNLRGYCCGRRSWLFFYSTGGAEASAMIYTMVETARHNNADARMYIQYLLENMRNYSVKPDGSSDDEFLAKMTPWSDAFRDYEKKKKQEALDLLSEMFRKSEKPQIPHSKKPPGRPPSDRETLKEAV